MDPEKLRQLQFQAALLDQVHSAIIATNMAGIITYWSAFAEQLYGWQSDEVLGKNILEITPAHAEADAAAILAQIAVHGSWAGEFEVKRKDGSIFPALVTDSLVRDADGKPVGFVGVSIDVSEQKSAERELAEKARALACSNADLQQFAYVASHDLQEPLRTISGFASLIEQRCDLGRAGAEYLSFIVAAAERMRAVVDAFLTYSRGVSNEPEPVAPVPMDSVSQWVRMNLDRLIHETRAVITTDELPVVEGHQEQLVQVLQNLIANAIKYRRAEPPRLHIGARKGETEWVFAVRDNGIGFRPEYAERIFGLFKRLHGQEIPGSGIGLALCRRIIEQHGGRIWAESQEGVGSVFYFTLPQ
jgi:PAS domain S-box-containing protein